MNARGEKFAQASRWMRAVCRGRVSLKFGVHFVIVLFLFATMGFHIARLGFFGPQWSCYKGSLLYYQHLLNARHQSCHDLWWILVAQPFLNGVWKIRSIPCMSFSWLLMLPVSSTLVSLFSYTLSREYRYSQLLFTSEDRLCTNLRVQEQSTNMTSQCQCPTFAWRHGSTVVTSQY